jgi:tRNA(fMet)-specific endonuclease VapC
LRAYRNRKKWGLARQDAVPVSIFSQRSHRRPVAFPAFGCLRLLLARRSLAGAVTGLVMPHPCQAGDSPTAQLYRKHVDGKRLALCFMTVAELYLWAKRRSWGQKKIDDLRAKLKNYGVLSFDDETAWNYAAVRPIPEHPVDHGDAWIAATALRHGWALVTHNKKALRAHIRVASHFRSLDRKRKDVRTGPDTFLRASP